MKFISITLVVTTITLFLNTKAAVSDVASELGNMFDSLGFDASVSDGGAYNSQTRGYMVGGSIRARTPTKYIQPVNIQLPSFKSGCGGIDMNFGGFSFINSEEFKTFLQNAGSQALGYAFMQAIEAVCPTCRSVLDSLRKMADAINKFGLDSCTAAKAAVNTAWGALPAKFHDAVAEWGETQNGLWSEYKGTIDAFSRGLSEQHAKVYEMARDPKNPIKTGVSTSENLSTALNEEQMELAISLLGTMAPEWKADPDTGELVPTASCIEIGATLTVEDLMKGYREDNPLKVIRCARGSFNDKTCDQIGYGDVSASFKGFEDMARTQLTGIMDKIQNNEPLTPQQRSFVNSVNIPIMSALRTSLAASPEIATTIIEEISDLTALAYALHVYKTYIGIYKLNAKKHICGDVPRERYIKASEEFARQADQYMRNINMLDKVVALLKTIEKTTNEAASKRLRSAMATINW